MSASNQTAGPSTDNFTSIFNAALNEYQRLTGKSLDTHPFAAQLDTCQNPEAVSDLLRTQAQAFRKFREGDERLMAWLDPTIHVLSTFSDTLGEGIGLVFSPAKTIFTGIGVLLEAVKAVEESHDALVHLFERIHFFLQRLKTYTGLPLTSELKELLGKIMAQLLSILGLSTKAMTDKRIKKILKKLVGKTDVEDALSRLDMLTKEETLAVVVRNLEVTHHVDGVVHDIGSNVKASNVVTEDIDKNVKEIEQVARSVDNVALEIKRNQMQEKLRSWLSPPDPSDWKKNGCLLWVRGNPGAGKSILCSAIIEDIKNMQKSLPSLFAYYYFDFKDAFKRGLRGLLTSLLFQLVGDSAHCWDVLYELYTSCRDGSAQPSDVALAGCLKDMLKLPEQLPIFLIVDALDECPNTDGTPSAREEVLNFLEDLVGSSHSKLFICVTSRPEQDIQTVLNPLTSASCRVSLHEEDGQREDIKNYVLSFVHNDRAMRRWREEDRNLVITTLIERAGGMFRWAFCQLDTLRRCMPSSICKALNELPTTLDETYERVLDGIPKEKRQHAHRLFRCLVVAVRPLRAEELAELFAIEFDLDAGKDARPNLKEGWRPENAEDAVLSACSTLIAVNENEGSQIVHFSHFSVKEYLTSDRLRTSEIGNIRHYHIPLDAAHTILARACLAVLLQLDENVDKERLKTFPLASYAAKYWVDHAQYGDVTSRIQHAMELLFNPSMPYLASWTWIHDVDVDLAPWEVRKTIDSLEERPKRPKETALYYAALCGFSGLTEHFIVTHRENVNAKCGVHGTPLHAASHKGHLDTARLLLVHGADLNIVYGHYRSRIDKVEKKGIIPLCSAYGGGHLDVMRLLLERGADANVCYFNYQVEAAGVLSHRASRNGQIDILRLLLQHDADVNARGHSNETALHHASMQERADVVLLLLLHNADVDAKDAHERTPLHIASGIGHARVAELLLEHGAVINAEDDSHCTPLYDASRHGRFDVVKILLGHGADVRIRGEGDLTPFQVATSEGHIEIAQLLLEHGAENDTE